MIDWLHARIDRAESGVKRNFDNIPFVRGLRGTFFYFVIARVSKEIKNMHRGEWICTINGMIRVVLCFIYTPVFTASLEKDDNQRTELRAIPSPLCHSVPYLIL